jgi:VanZ family protein
VAEGRPRAGYLLAGAIIVAIIVYGSLYPFAFRRPAHGAGPLRTLLDSWAQMPRRGDFVANILFYMPIGFFVSLAGSRRALPAIALATLFGALLSSSMELAQYYVVERVTSAIDVYANVIGAALGATIGSLANRAGSRPVLGTIAANRVPWLLLGLWAGYRLFPYVPTIDLHKFWDALKPVVLYPSLNGQDLFRHTAIWLTIGALVEAIGGTRRAWILFPLFMTALITARMLIVGTVLSMAELAGAGAAFAVWIALAIGGPKLRVVLITLLLGAAVAAARLAPFRFTEHGRPFGWVPFHGFMHGSIEVNMMSFFEKAFLYGSLVWLLGRVGLHRGISVLLVVAMLFATSWAETRLAGRSGEITDAVIALIIGVILALMERGNRERAPRPVK